MINALVLSLKELLLMNGILYDVSAFIVGLQSITVKVGCTLAFEETSCWSTLVFETIFREYAEHKCLLCILCIRTLKFNESAEGVSNGAMLGVLFILFNVAEKDFGFRKLYLLSDIRNLK